MTSGGEKVGDTAFNDGDDKDAWSISVKGCCHKEHSHRRIQYQENPAITNTDWTIFFVLVRTGCGLHDPPTETPGRILECLLRVVGVFKEGVIRLEIGPDLFEVPGD